MGDGAMVGSEFGCGYEYSIFNIQYLGFNQEWVSGVNVGSEFGCEYEYRMC